MQVCLPNNPAAATTPPLNNNKQPGTTTTMSIENGMLPPEPQEGNVEYKLKLVSPSRQRLEHLVTQMKWRLREGHGEAIYEIGVEDCGRLRGLSPSDMAASLKTLRDMTAKLGASLVSVRESVVDGSGLAVAEVVVRKIPDQPPTATELRVAVMGPENAGKSTVLGVLTQGELDDGRGRARLNTFRHLHEVRTGRTSSISHELVGFDDQGRLLNHQEGSPETICQLSSKIVTLLDLGGHAKYLRTTLHGVSGYCPHYIFFTVAAPQGFGKVQKEYLTLAVALQIPLVVVVTKCDLVSGEDLEGCVEEVRVFLAERFEKEAVRMREERDVTSFIKDSLESVGSVPLLTCSSVTGQGLDLVTFLLFHLVPVTTTAVAGGGVAGVESRDSLEKEPAMFQIDEVWKIPNKEIVLGGLLKQGVLKERSTVLLGPFFDGTRSFFKPVTVSSIRRHKTPCLVARATQCISLSLLHDSNSQEPVVVRKGMVLVSPQLDPQATFLFKASILVLHHSGLGITKGFNCTVHVGNVRQTAKIEQILSLSRVKTNERATVLFSFLRVPEYLQTGSSLLFRDGSTKGLGTVIDVFPARQGQVSSSSSISH